MGGNSVFEDARAFLEKSGIPIVGVADARELDRIAPEGFRPSDFLPGARSVVVAARPLPLAIFQTPRNNLFYSFYTSSFHAYYQSMNDAVNTVCLMLEDAGYPSLPVPSYSPLRFHKGEPRGLLSLKHCAQAAGLGSMGRNTLLIHPKEGNILRLGGLVTAMELPATAADGDLSRLCPEKCGRCIEACPVGALSSKGIDKMKCMGNCIKHILLPPSWSLPLMRWALARSRFLTGLTELFTLSLFESYGVSCFACLTACPHFPGNRSAGKRA